MAQAICLKKLFVMKNYSSKADLELESKKLMVLMKIHCANNFRAVKCD